MMKMVAKVSNDLRRLHQTRSSDLLSMNHPADQDQDVNIITELVKGSSHSASSLLNRKSGSDNDFLWDSTIWAFKQLSDRQASSQTF